ncbi:MAG: hypothetical protein K0S29_1328 [Gammaproteobacteria bacterium]|jgi:hypothetical protein|nr:hypothetical protein [Gammaproteobacteria bacterium]
MLVIVCCLLLLIFWVKASRINPSKYPHVEPEQVMLWQNMQLAYCRRFTGLLLLWILLAIGNGLLLNQALKSPNMVWHYAYFTCLALTSIYLIAGIVFIVISAVKMRKWAKAQGILPRPKTIKA